MTLPIAIVGVGKIARDQHLPTIADSDRFRLAGAVSRHDPALDVPVRDTLTALKEAVPELAAVAICTPPVGRSALLEEAFALGLDVLMEKPPAETLGEAETFAPAALRYGRVLYQSWHSRTAAAVEPARAWLSGRRIEAIAIDWLEDVRVWHPGQEWIWSPGIGVFDPGINALSILTRLLDDPVRVAESRMTFPDNRAAPIAADLSLRAGDVPVAVRFSFDQRGPQTWTISARTDRGTLRLLDGGARWEVDGQVQPLPDDRSEYARLYDRFADLIASGESDVDLSPFRLVADAFLLGERRVAGPFGWDDRP